LQIKGRVFGVWELHAKRLFLCAGEVAGLRGAQSTPFLGQPSALLAFSSESVSHQGWERGKVSSISESGKGAAASLRSPASPCGSRQCRASMCVCVYVRTYAFVMNHPAIVCSPPCCPAGHGAFHLGCCLPAGLLPRWEEEEEEEGLLVVIKARLGRAAIFRLQHPVFPLSPSGVPSF